MNGGWEVGGGATESGVVAGRELYVQCIGGDVGAGGLADVCVSAEIGSGEVVVGEAKIGGVRGQGCGGRRCLDVAGELCACELLLGSEIERRGLGRDVRFVVADGFGGESARSGDALDCVVGADVKGEFGGGEFACGGGDAGGCEADGAFRILLRGRTGRLDVVVSADEANIMFEADDSGVRVVGGAECGAGSLPR